MFRDEREFRKRAAPGAAREPVGVLVCLCSFVFSEEQRPELACVLGQKGRGIETRLSLQEDQV